MGNKHTLRDMSCAKYKTPFEHSNRRLTNVRHSNARPSFERSNSPG